MSDYYDSLEDDSDEKKSARGFPNSLSEFLNSVRSTGKGSPQENFSFFLNKNPDKFTPNQLSFFPFNETLPEKENFLPKIENRSNEEGALSVCSLNVDNTILNAQGLQLNSDGSFTKSPRPEKEKLPFITREYRNLQFQKKKTYHLSKKTSNKALKKNSIAPVENSKEEMNVDELHSINKEESSEGLLIAEGFSSKSSKQLKSNLTDSMKEKILQTLRENRLQDSNRSESFRKHEMSESKIKQLNNQCAGRKRVVEVKPKDFRQSRNAVLKSKPNIKPNILLTAAKPKLNYSERHQLEKGFVPFCLRQEKKKVPQDTDRSNFGDSEIAELPEVSSRVMSCDNLRDEEETFYQKLIQRDKTLKQTQYSSRSDGPIERLRLQEGIEPQTYKFLREMIRGRSNSKPKQNSKSLSIDLPSDCSPSEISLKKNSHNCSTNTSTFSKLDLALKAKTYGYMANARNIFRLKTQSVGKSNTKERQNNNLKHKEVTEKKPLNPSISSRRLIKQNSLPANAFPKVEKELIRNLAHLPMTGASLAKSKELGLAVKTQKDLVLPQVISMEATESKMNARALEQISSCLRTPTE